jgi:hypothetical protein
MDIDEGIEKHPFSVSDLYINAVHYQEYSNIADLAPQRFVQKDGVLYFCVKEDADDANKYNPAWLFRNEGIRFSIGFGLTTGNTYIRDFVGYRSGLDFALKLTEEADELTAKKMKFYSGSLTLINTDGAFDDNYELFGNTVQIFGRDGADRNGDNRQELIEYYVKNTKTKLDTAVITLADKRQRLTQKIPRKRFTVDDYPFMQRTSYGDQKDASDKLGELIPDAYGVCINLPAVCVDEFEIFTGAGLANLKQYRTFRVARTITRLDKVMVKMTQPDGGGEVWTTQFERNAAGQIIKNNLGMGTPQANYLNGSRGEIKIHISKCMPPTFNGGWEGDEVPEIYEVVVSGEFGGRYNNETGAFLYAVNKPAQIIQELLLEYAETAFDDVNYVVSEWTAEICGLKPVGLLFDSEVDLFSAIEKVQNASDYNFLFLTAFDRWTARRDYNERPLYARNIKAIDIINIDEVEIDLNGDQYASKIDLAFSHDYLADTAQHYVYNENERALLNFYHVEKVCFVESGLSDRADIEAKAQQLGWYFSKMRPRINGVKLFGKDWFNIRVYEIINIDLRAERDEARLPKRLVGLVNFARDNYVAGGGAAGRDEILAIEGAMKENKNLRNFGGLIRCKVLKVQKDTQKETVILDLIFID